jgi:hypothetical protein
MKSTKEGDLLIISKSELITSPHKTNPDDIKGVMTLEWLKANINQVQCTFGFVTERSKRGPLCITIKMCQAGFEKLN